MEFGEKLAALRKQSEMTQQQLAEKLFVSRTAVSKWESGKGYPNIDSLRKIAEIFGVSVDSLLSGEELMNLAEKDISGKQRRIRDLVFGLLDISVLSFMFLPLFGEKVDGYIYSVPMISLSGKESYVIIPYYILVFASVFWGIALLALQKCEAKIWDKYKYIVSVAISAVALAFFIMTTEPYVASLVLVFLMIKGVLLVKKN